MFKKRLLDLCNSSKKWIAMTVLMNWISIICNILVILFIGNTIDKLINSNLEINYLRDGLYITSLLVIRFLANFLIVTTAPSKAIGGNTILTREPSDSLVSTMGFVSLARLLVLATIC